MMERLRAMREPLKYVQGRDALLKFHEEMGYMGKRWLFVCSNSGYKACHDKIEKSFEGLDDYRRYEIFGGISSNGEINKMKAIVEQDNIDTVVAVGGGSAVDTAKATAYYSGKHIVIVPTVAATDAPCTGLSVIYNDDHSFDKYLFYPTNPRRCNGRYDRYRKCARQVPYCRYGRCARHIFRGSCFYPHRIRKP